MGCGCGGRKNVQRSSAVTPRPAGEVGARMVRSQTNQRQALIQQAKERIQQTSGGQTRNVVGAREEIERRRRIQVSLRNRNSRG